MRFLLRRKTICRHEGHVAVVVNSVPPLMEPRVIYGDGLDVHETVFCLETEDKAFQFIGTYGGFTRLSDGIAALLYEWIYNHGRMDWLGYPPAETQERDAGNGRQDNG